MSKLTAVCESKKHDEPYVWTYTGSKQRGEVVSCPKCGYKVRLPELGGSLLAEEVNGFEYGTGRVRDETGYTIAWASDAVMPGDVIALEKDDARVVEVYDEGVAAVPMSDGTVDFDEGMEWVAWGDIVLKTDRKQWEHSRRLEDPDNRPDAIERKK